MSTQKGCIPVICLDEFTGEERFLTQGEQDEIRSWCQLNKSRKPFKTNKIDF